VLLRQLQRRDAANKTLTPETITIFIVPAREPNPADMATFQALHSQIPAKGSAVRVSRAKPIQTVKTGPGSDRNEMVVDLGYGLSSGPISLSPPHGQGTRGCHDIAHGEEGPSETPGHSTPLVRASAPHGVSGRIEPEATWAQPLSREELS
jgi:hypothetical protein